jgi:hypothetical protein
MAPVMSFSGQPPLKVNTATTLLLVTWVWQLLQIGMQHAQQERSKLTACPIHGNTRLLIQPVARLATHALAPSERQLPMRSITVSCLGQRYRTTAARQHPARSATPPATHQNAHRCVCAPP